MRSILAVMDKELRHIFNSATAYVTMGIFFLLVGFFFFDRLMEFVNYQAQGQFNATNDIIAPLCAMMSYVLLLIVPIITMRLYAEEKSLGTDEMLLTSPISVWQIVLGKFLAAALFYLLILALTLFFPGILLQYVGLDWGQVLTNYLGLLLMGVSFISFGLFSSTMTRSQLIAAIVSFAVLFGFWILGWLAESLLGAAADILKYLAFTEHFLSFNRGVLHTGDVVYFISFIVFFLFLSARAVESSRWR